MVNSVLFSPDGTTLASAGGRRKKDYGNKPDHYKVRLWDVVTGSVKATLPEHTDSASRIWFSPDGKTLVSKGAEPDDKVHLWDVATGTLKATLSEHTDSAVVCCLFNPDGKTVASLSGNGGVHLWDVATGTVKTTLDTGKIRSVSFSRMAKYLPVQVRTVKFFYGTSRRAR